MIIDFPKELVDKAYSETLKKEASWNVLLLEALTVSGYKVFGVDETSHGKILKMVNSSRQIKKVESQLFILDETEIASDW